jgi:Zn-dependent protease with chaperone function
MSGASNFHFQLCILHFLPPCKYAVSLTNEVKGALLYGGSWPLGVLVSALALIISIGCQAFGAALALGRAKISTSASWAERARLTYPALRILSIGPWILGFVSLAFAEALARDLSFTAYLSTACMAISVLAAAFVTSRIESTLKQRPITFRDWIRHELIICSVFAPHIVVIVPVAISMPDRFSVHVWSHVYVACAGILFYLFSSGLFVMRLLGLARTAPERLRQITRISADRLGIAPTTNYLLRWKDANAVAFPLINRMAFSDTALKYLTNEELIAVCVHEFAHLTESRAVKSLRVLSAFAWLPVIFAKPIANAYGAAGLVVAGIAVLLAHRAVRALVLAMEKRADALGGAHEGEPGTYARALERIYEINLFPAVIRDKRLTHPHLYDRLVAAHVVPSYARPGPPPRWRGRISFLAMIVFAVLLWSIPAVIITIILK